MSRGQPGGGRSKRNGFSGRGAASGRSGSGQRGSSSRRETPDQRGTSGPRASGSPRGGSNRGPSSGPDKGPKSGSNRGPNRGPNARRTDDSGPSAKTNYSRRPDQSNSLGGGQVEGRQAVRELLLAGRRRVREVLIATDRDDAEVLNDIAELALDQRVLVNEVSRQKLYSIARTEAPQGVVAKADELSPVGLEDLMDGLPGAPPFLLALDGVTDPGNLGALLRSADGAGVTGIVLPRHRAVHITPTVTKTAAGAVEYLPMALVGGIASAVSQMQKAGMTVLGLDMGGSRQLFDLADGVADGPVCLVMGAEGRGLSRLVRQRCDEVVGIPLLGNLASLNVAAAGALACFEIARGRLK